MPGIIKQCYTAFACSFGVICSGMAYGWVSPIMNKLMDTNGEIRATEEQISWIAADIELGCLTTPLVASFLMDRYGRKWPMLIAVPLFIISWTLTLTTHSVWILYIKRVLDGMALGLVVTVAPVYLAEIAEAKIRGFIILSNVVSWFLGTLIQFCLGSYLSYNLTAWINLGSPILYFSLFSCLPESPYYLMMRGQTDKATASLAWFRNSHPSQVFKEINSISQYLEDDSKRKESWYTLFSNRVYRKCMIIMFVMVVATIMTGLTTISSYASDMFADADGFLSPEICSVAVAFIFLVLSIIICLVIDKFGRRPLVILSAFGCFISNLSSAVFFYYKDRIQLSWVPLVTISSYCIFVSIGLNPVLISFQGELFPASMKGLASGLIQICVTLTSLVTVKCYFVIGSALGFHVNYFIYAFIAGISTIWLYFNVPETKNKTFNELLNVFEKLYGKKNVQISEELQQLKK